MQSHTCGVQVRSISDICRRTRRRGSGKMYDDKMRTSLASASGFISRAVKIHLKLKFSENDEFSCEKDISGI